MCVCCVCVCAVYCAVLCRVVLRGLRERAQTVVIFLPSRIPQPERDGATIVSHHLRRVVVEHPAHVLSERLFKSGQKTSDPRGHVFPRKRVTRIRHQPVGLQSAQRSTGGKETHAHAGLAYGSVTHHDAFDSLQEVLSIALSAWPHTTIPREQKDKRAQKPKATTCAVHTCPQAHATLVNTNEDNVPAFW